MISSRSDLTGNNISTQSCNFVFVVFKKTQISPTLLPVSNGKNDPIKGELVEEPIVNFRFGNFWGSMKQAHNPGTSLNGIQEQYAER